MRNLALHILNPRLTNASRSSHCAYTITALEFRLHLLVLGGENWSAWQTKLKYELSLKAEFQRDQTGPESLDLGMKCE